VNISTAFDRDQMPAIVEQLYLAWNSHDIFHLGQYLHPHYVSVCPLHPDRNFHGREHALLGWEAVFSGIPDFQAELLDCAVAGGCIWTEWRWHGHTRDGISYEAGGVMIFRLIDGLITSARLYTETLACAGPGFDPSLDGLLRQY
jgi:ketosteroid isomerase-like protein